MFTHLMNSVVQVERLSMTTANGRASMAWVVMPSPLDRVRCRLDLNFLRPGKDMPMPIEAGKAPDRIGVMFTYSDVPIRAGDRLRAVVNDAGQQPVPGVFEIRVMPDVAQDYSGGHHIEVQVVEVSQPVADSVLPGLVTHP